MTNEGEVTLPAHHSRLGKGGSPSKGDHGIMLRQAQHDKLRQAQHDNFDWIHAIIQNTSGGEVCTPG